MATKKTQADDSAHNDVLTMPLDVLKERAAEARELLARLEQILPGLVQLTQDARRHSGSFRDGEAEALGSLLEVAEKRPALFEVLADEDAGDDPTRFEPELIRDRLERLVALGPLVADAEEVANAVSDTRRYLGNLTRPVLLAMYEIAKPQAKRDATLATLCRSAIDFYGAIGRTAARRRANKAADSE